LPSLKRCCCLEPYILQATGNHVLLFLILVSRGASDHTPNIPEVLHPACDDPSGKLYAALREELSNLKCLSLDPPHLPIVYESARWEKKSAGSLCLRRIMKKFSVAGVVQPAAQYYTGTQELTTTRDEDRYFSQLQNRSMPATAAKKVLDEVDCNVCFSTRAEFVKCLAAHCVVYEEEMDRKTASARSLHALLVSAAAPARTEWLLNGTRFRCELSASELSMLGDGSMSCEALNNEIKPWFLGSRMHRPIARLKLLAFQLMKLCSHNCALYHPTTVQMRQSWVVARRAASFNPWSDERGWQQWCRELRSEDSFLKKGRTTHGRS
jgi:hypothetical protein